MATDTSEKAGDQPQSDITRVKTSLPTPFYETAMGAAYLGDANVLLKGVPSNTVQLIMTSPPFALKRKKPYGNVDADDYTEWFKPFAEEFWRILRADGSLVLHLGGSWHEGQPTRTLYQWELLIALCKSYAHKFHLAQDFYCWNPARLPSPAEWVNVKRIRVKDTVDFVWGYPRHLIRRQITAVFQKITVSLWNNSFVKGIGLDFVPPVTTSLQSSTKTMEELSRRIFCPLPILTQTAIIYDGVVRRDWRPILLDTR